MYWNLFWTIMALSITGKYLLMCYLNYLLHKLVRLTGGSITTRLKCFTALTGFGMLIPYCLLSIVFPSLRDPSTSVLLMFTLMLPFVLPMLWVRRFRPVK